MGTATHCQHCGQALHGRTDKRFCNDDCRNSYNRAQKQAYKAGENPNIPTILKIIRQNYERLRASAMAAPDTSTSFNSGRPEDIGINTRFYTSTYEENGQIWYCCFDYGWRNYERGGWEIRYLTRQADLK